MGVTRATREPLGSGITGSDTAVRWEGFRKRKEQKTIMFKKNRSVRGDSIVMYLEGWDEQ